MGQITPYQSIKEEAVRRKFARFKQLDRARAKEGLGEGAWGGGVVTEERRREERRPVL